MAPQTPKVPASSLGVTMMKKKEPEKGSISSTQKAANFRTSAIDLSSFLEKKSVCQNLALENKKKIIENIHIKEKEEEESPISTPKHGSTTAKD